MSWTDIRDGLLLGIVVAMVGMLALAF